MANSQVSLIMGSVSDWGTLKSASKILTDFDIAYEVRVISAHRTPKLLYEFSQSAKSRGIKIIIAAAGAAAHLPGMTSALSILPVLGVPVKSKTLNGIDSLLSIVQMPAGIPTATFAIGDSGAINAALFAVRILAITDEILTQKLTQYITNQENSVLESEKQLLKDLDL